MADRGGDVKRIVVVGGGLIGVRHARSVAPHPRCELVGVVDPDPARHTEPCRYFSDMDAVDAPVDGAIIATPTDLHSAHGIFAARRGWGVLIEKPVAGTLADADALADVIAGTGVSSLVGHHRRYHPSVQKLKAMIAEGAIGQPVTSTMIWAVRKPDDYFAGNWRTQGGSPVMINLVHDVDLLRFVLGDVTAVAGLGAQPVRQAGRVESGAVALSFASGATAAISFADTAPGPWGFEAGTGENPNIAATGQDMWWITGTGGGIAFPSLTHWSGAADWSQAPEPARIAVERVVPLDAQLEHFVDVMENAAAPLIDVADARKTLETALKIEAALG